MRISICACEFFNDFALEVQISRKNNKKNTDMKFKWSIHCIQIHVDFEHRDSF